MIPVLISESISPPGLNMVIPWKKGMEDRAIDVINSVGEHLLEARRMVANTKHDRQYKDGSNMVFSIFIPYAPPATVQGVNSED